MLEYTRIHEVTSSLSTLQQNLDAKFFCAQHCSISGVQVLQSHRVLVDEVGRDEPGRVKVGVPWSAEEFAANALRLEHPYGAEPTLPRCLRGAVCHCLANSVQESEVVRERASAFWMLGRVRWRRVSKLCTRPLARR